MELKKGGIMNPDKLSGFFEQYLESDSLFKNKNVFRANFTPDTLFHREEQVKLVAQTLAPCLKLQKPSNLFIYGKTGTGKTLTIHYVTQQILTLCIEKKIPVRVIYINCKLKKVADTEYRIIAQLARELGKDIPATGLPTDEVYRIFSKALEETKSIVLLVLDEIDQLVKKVGDEVLYSLTRINTELKDTQISLIGISNDLRFTEYLDPRVKSSLSEEEIIFPPYNAVQIQKILRQRSEQGFLEEVLVPGLIEKCAAIAAREHGDARRALELLRVAGELAERENESKVAIKHLDQAEQKIESDRIIHTISTAPKQSQLVMYSLLHLYDKKPNDNLFTGQVYEFYQALSKRVRLRPLTQRRISDILSELDMLGIIQSKVISKGRYGRTREILVPLDASTRQHMKHLLKEGLDL